MADQLAGGLFLGRVGGLGVDRPVVGVERVDRVGGITCGRGTIAQLSPMGRVFGQEAHAPGLKRDMATLPSRKSW